MDQLKSLIFIVLLFTAVKGQDLKKTIDSINNLSAVEYLGNLYKSENIFNENLKQARSIGYRIGEAKSLNILAIIYYLMGKYEKSTEYNIKSLKIFEEEKDYNALADAYGEYGYQMKRREFEKANAYMLNGIKIDEEHKVGKITLAKLYDNYGVIKEMEGKLDSALLLYNKSLKIKQELNDSIGIPFSLNKIANSLGLIGKFSEAYGYLKQSDKFREKEKSDFGRADNLAYYGDFLAMENKIDSAIDYYNRSLALSLKNGYTFLIQYLYQRISDLYSKKNDHYNSLQYFKKYTAYKDSITNLETNKKIAELEITFESSVKDKLITQKQLLLKQRTILFLIIGTMLLFITLTMVGLYAYQFQKRKAIDNELKLNRIIAQEEIKRKIFEEKLRISRELHDNIGSQLTFIISSLENLAYQQNGNIWAKKIKNLNDFARSSLNELRNTIWAMKSENGNISTLILKIRDFINRNQTGAERLSITIQNNTSTNYRLNSNQLLNLFRIFQECFQNILKHSEATECKIVFEDSLDGFTMKICDNGKGLDLKENLESTGLSSMAFRAKEANGNFIIEKKEDCPYKTIMTFKINTNKNNN